MEKAKPRSIKIGKSIADILDEAVIIKLLKTEKENQAAIETLEKKVEELTSENLRLRQRIQ